MKGKVLNIELRTETGKNESYRMRTSGYIPAVLYSHGKASSIKIPRKDFFQLFKGHISESVIFNLHFLNKSDEEEQMAFVKDYQKHPVSGDIVHVDLFKVTAGEKIHTMVPLELSGAPIGVKSGGVLEIHEREISLECLPKDLPEKIIIDVTSLEVGHNIYAREIKLGDGLKLLSNPEMVIAGVAIPRAVEEKEAATEAVAVVEAGAGETKEVKDGKDGKESKDSKK